MYSVILLVTFFLVGVVAHLAAYFVYVSQKNPEWRYRAPSTTLVASHWALTISVILLSVVFLVSTFKKRGFCWWFFIVLLCVVVFAMYLLYMLVYFLGESYAGLPEFRTPQSAISSLEEAQSYYVDYAFYYEVSDSRVEGTGKGASVVTVTCETGVIWLVTVDGWTTATIPDIESYRHSANAFLVEVKGSVDYHSSVRIGSMLYIYEDCATQWGRDIERFDRYVVYGVPDLFGVSRDGIAPPGTTKTHALVSGLFFSGATFAYLSALPIFTATYETWNATIEEMYMYPMCYDLGGCDPV